MQCKCYYKKKSNFQSKTWNGQFQNKSLNTPLKNDFTMKLGRISGGVLIH